MGNWHIHCCLVLQLQHFTFWLWPPIFIVLNIRNSTAELSHIAWVTNWVLQLVTSLVLVTWMFKLARVQKMRKWQSFVVTQVTTVLSAVPSIFHTDLQEYLDYHQTSLRVTLYGMEQDYRREGFGWDCMCISRSLFLMWNCYCCQCPLST